MTKYQCDKGHTFLFPQLVRSGSSEHNFIEFKVCPVCPHNNAIIEETVETTINVESVYIYELTTGPQTALDALLAQGYVITNRYAKAYHLEKPKAVESPQEAEDKFTEDAKLYYAKLHPGETPQ